MSRFEAPLGIVTNGLVLNLDAGDPDSFTRQFPFSCDALIVAGGGSGGVDNGGGGGGGGVLDKRNLQLSAGTAYTITIGAGGAARPGSSDDGPGNNGSNTTALGYTAIGGGGGSGWVNTALPPGQSSYVGGSGAGQSNSTGGSNSLGIGIALQPTSSDGGMGNNGGAAFPPYAGGGGGAGGSGGNAGSGFAGNGGNGYFLNGAYGSGIGVSDRVGGGGAGGWDVISGYSSNPVPTAQNGTIKKTTQTAEDPATSNSGAGGNGGNHNNNSSGAGGSGVVVICYPGLPAATGGDILYENGKTYHRFFSSGTFTPYPWNDLSGNNNSGSLINGVGFNSYQNGGYLSFDGVDDRVATSFKPSGYRSYFVWIKYNITSSLPAGYSLTGTQEANAYNYVGIENGGKFYYFFGTNGESLAGTVLSPNVWYYQGLTLSSDGNARAYLNGTLVSTLASGVGNTATAEFSVGAINQNHWVNGSIASVVQYNRTLSQAEITQNYNAQKARFGL
jgi:hypothetical protein